MDVSCLCTYIPLFSAASEAASHHQRSYVIKEWLGRDNINSTQRYARVDMKTKHEVMEGKKVVRLKKKKVIKIKERGEHE
jgi:hypothetical protein